MGQQAACTLTFEGRKSEGTAWLEHKDLVFRGPLRLAVPLKDITAAVAAGGRLTITFGDRSAELEIGEAAAKWAQRITNPPSRLDKLGIKPGMSVLMIDFTDRQLSAELRERGARIARTHAKGEGSDVIFFGAPRRDALRGLAAAVTALKSNGALWIIRPKGSTAITEAETMAAGKRAGLVDVKVVSFSDTHTAEKFVIPVAKRPRAR